MPGDMFVAVDSHRNQADVEYPVPFVVEDICAEAGPGYRAARHITRPGVIILLYEEGIILKVKICVDNSVCPTACQPRLVGVTNSSAFYGCASACIRRLHAAAPLRVGWSGGVEPRRDRHGAGAGNGSAARGLERRLGAAVSAKDAWRCARTHVIPPAGGLRIRGSTLLDTDGLARAKPQSRRGFAVLDALGGFAQTSWTDVILR
jgi:hypothetical protein